MPDDDASIIHCDQLLKEYLVFRGFTKSLTSFEAERKSDKNKAFQTEKIVEQLFTFLQSFDIQSFVEYWKYLEQRFFNKLYESSSNGIFSSNQNNNGGDSMIIDSANMMNTTGSSLITSSSAQSLSSNTDLNGMDNNTSQPNPSPITNASGNNVQQNNMERTFHNSNIGSLLGRHASSSTSSYYETIRRLEQSLKKYFVVNCVQKGRLRECREFFERFGHELIQENEWRPWFALPYLLASAMGTSQGREGQSDSTSLGVVGLMTPERDRRDSSATNLMGALTMDRSFNANSVLSIVEQSIPELEPYFHRKWAEMLYMSVQNFMATAILSVEKPQLLLMESEKRDRQNVLKKKLDVLTSENETLKSKLLAAEAYISKLEVEVGIRREGGVSSSGDNSTDHGRSPSFTSQPETSDNPSSFHNRSISLNTSFSSLNISTVRQSNTSESTPQKQLSPVSPVPNERGRTPTSVDSGVVTTSVFDNIQLFNVKPLFPMKIFTGHKDYVTSVKFSQDGRFLASSSKDNTVRVWSLSGSKESSNSGTPSFSSLQTYECGTKAMCLDWWSSSSGKKSSTSSSSMIVCGLNNRKVKLLDLDKRKCVGEFCTEIFFPKVNAIACCGSSIRNSDYCVVSCSSYQKTDSGSNTPVTMPASNTNTNSPSSSVTGMLLGYNLSQLKLDNKFLVQPKSAPILDIKFNHNGTMIVTSSADGFVRIFDTASKQQQPIWSWKAHEGEVTNVHFSENETSVLTCGSDGKLIEWSLHNTGKILNQIQLQSPVAFGDKHNSNWIDTKIGLCSTSERMFVLNYPGVIFSMLHNSPTHCLMTKDFYSHNLSSQNNTTLTAQDFAPMTNVDWFNAAFGGGSSSSPYQYLNWIAASHGMNNNIYLYNMDMS